MNKQNKTYNATDFANYHAGTMPMADMYALEKATLEDAFLADALEGYAFSKNASEELIAIKESMQPQTAKIIPIAKANNNWLKYAAAAVIVLGLGTLFYNINSKNATENIAKVDTKSKTQTDSIALVQEVAKVNNTTQNIEQNGNIVQNNNSEDAATKNVFSDTKAMPPSAAVTSSDYTENLNTLPNLNTNVNPNTNFNTTQSQWNNGIFQNNVESKTGGPKQLAINRNFNTQANSNTNFGDKAKFKTLAKADSTSFPIAMNDRVAEKVQAAPAAAAEKESAKPAAVQAEAKLEEVVVTTGYGEKKRKDVASSTNKTNAKILEGKVAGVVVNSDADGRYKNVEKNTNTAFQEFNSYVKKNIKPVFDDKGNEIKGIVKLSFKTNKAGQPIKIKVAQSLSKKCDAQVIELLKNATKWPANKSDRTMVEVNF